MKASFVKSGLRGIGYGLLAVFVPALIWAAFVLVVSEIIGIVEELVVE